jgi:hypothetical protein
MSLAVRRSKSRQRELLEFPEVMDIRFISSLTPDDENRIAPALLEAVASVLDRLPIAYTLRFETVTGRSFQHGRSPEDVTDELEHLGDLAAIRAVLRK